MSREADHEAGHDQKSQGGVFGLIGDLGAGLMRMLRDEWQLARLEAGYAMRLAVAAIIAFVLAAVLGLFALSLLLWAIRDWFVWLGLHPALASLSLAGGLLLIAGISAFIGARKLRLARLLAPRPPAFLAGFASREERLERRQAADELDRRD